VDVAWDAVAGATGGYVIERSDDGGASWRRAGATLAQGATAFTDSDLLADHAYAYRVRAVAGTVTSPYATAAPVRTAALRVTDSTGYFGPATPVGNYAVAPTGYEPFYTSGDLLSDRDPGDGLNNLMLPDDGLIRRQVEAAVNTWHARGFVIDIELGPDQGWYWDPYAAEPGAMERAHGTAARMAEVVDRIRYWAVQFGRPDMEVGIYGALPVLYEVAPDQPAAWRQSADFWAGKDRDGRRDPALLDLVAKFDFLSPILYSESSLDHQVQLARSYKAEAARLGKPLYTFLFEQYAPDRSTPEGSRADDARWRASLELAANLGDGVVLWCGRQRPYDPAETWLGQVRALTSAMPAAPAAPTNLAVAPGMRLTWSDSSVNEAGFIVERQDEDGPWRVVGGTTANVTTWIDPGRLGGYAWYSGGRYAYRVRAYNASADSATSAALVVTSASRDARSVNTAKEYNFRLVEQPTPSARMITHAYAGTYVRYDAVEFADDVSEFVASVGLIDGARDGNGNWAPFDDARIEVWIDGMDGTLGVPAGQLLGTLVCPTNGQTDPNGNGWYDYVRGRLEIPAGARPTAGRHDVYLRFAGQGGANMEWWSFGTAAAPAAPTQVQAVAWNDRQYAEPTLNQRVDVSFTPGDPTADHYRIERADRTDDAAAGAWAEVGRMGADQNGLRVFSDVSYRTGWLAAASTATRVVDGWTSASSMVLPGGYLWDGAFVGWTMTILDGACAGRSATVTAFDAGTRAFTLGGAGLSVAPDGTSHYRLTPPAATHGTLAAGGTATRLVAPDLGVPGGAHGWTIRMTSGASAGELVTIDRYDPSTRSFILQGDGLAAPPAGGDEFVLLAPGAVQAGHAYAYRVVAVNGRGETVSLASADVTPSVIDFG
jgi:hypothetical protein